MEIRDPVHGSIQISQFEVPIIEHPFFQRLRNIKQLGFSEYIFPGATHTRYIHSIGVMHTASMVFDKLFNHVAPSKELERLKETVKLAALLHDIGHAPLSHSTEVVMPQLSKLQIPKRFHLSSQDRQANHEDYTVKAIVDSFFTESFAEATHHYGVDPNCIAELILGTTTDPQYFTLNGTNYFPLFHQLISSEMDCDRMDYLLRDSYFCGVSYGKYDLDWIIDNLKSAVIDNKAFLAISERALTTFDDFLLSRFHMFIMVYFHYRAVCLEQMTYRYFDEEPEEYRIPAEIHEYLKHDDHYLQEVLRSSENRWAKKITKNQIPRKLFECFGNNDAHKKESILELLDNNGIEYILCESSGRLSKYYSTLKEPRESFPMKVAKQYGEIYIDINEATDLFSKYSHAHAVSRIHADLDDNNQELVQKIHAIIQE
ncbi:MAG: HD domain-containing protein [Halobacteriovoraceae bacterium]|nr:HD domain-containing protein [Halobacteriovoraceae bacterium]MCB9094241.1 HD domain-containing protein [Halobacteriovoraceae bacterium]